MRRHGILYHVYADDTQIYLTFKSSVLGDMELSRERVEACVRDIYRWMLYNNLKMNNDKTELLILHSRYRPRPYILKSSGWGLEKSELPWEQNVL